MTKAKFNSTTISPYLISSRPLIVLPELAEAIGLDEAIFLQQLHFLLTTKEDYASETDYKNGRLWIYNTLEEWNSKYFTFWSKRTLQRIITKLVNDSIVQKDKFNFNKSDHKLWYTINYEKLNLILKQKHDEAMEKAIKEAETLD